jgi:hypothetical protein
MQAPRRLGGYALRLTRDLLVAQALDLWVDWFYRQCTRVPAPTQAVANALEARGLAGRCGVWGRGVDTELLTPERRDSAVRGRLLEDGDLLLLSVGRTTGCSPTSTRRPTFSASRVRPTRSGRSCSRPRPHVFPLSPSRPEAPWSSSITRRPGWSCLQTIPRRSPPRCSSWLRTQPVAIATAAPLGLSPAARPGSGHGRSCALHIERWRKPRLANPGPSVSRRGPVSMRLSCGDTSFPVGVRPRTSTPVHCPRDGPRFGRRRSRQRTAISTGTSTGYGRSSPARGSRLPSAAIRWAPPSPCSPHIRTLVRSIAYCSSLLPGCL